MQKKLVMYTNKSFTENAIRKMKIKPQSETRLMSGVTRQGQINESQKRIERYGRIIN